MNALATTALVVAILAFSMAVWFAVTWLVMVIVGAIGHIFNIEILTLLSFWNMLLIGFIFGLLGFGGGSAK